MNRVVAFTGHRPDKVGGFEGPVREWLRKQLVDLQPAAAISGVARGVDSWAAAECFNLGIPFTAAVPFEGQEGLWMLPDRIQYSWLLSKARDIVYVSKPPSANWKYAVRNQWMVDRCTHLLAVYDGSRGGTQNCWKYAHRAANAPVILRYNPLTQETT